jgi:hypothetical protein
MLRTTSLSAVAVVLLSGLLTCAGAAETGGGRPGFKLVGSRRSPLPAESVRSERADRPRSLDLVARSAADSISSRSPGGSPLAGVASRGASNPSESVSSRAVLSPNASRRSRIDSSPGRDSEGTERSIQQRTRTITR